MLLISDIGALIPESLTQGISMVNPFSFKLMLPPISAIVSTITIPALIVNILMITLVIIIPIGGKQPPHHTNEGI